MNRHEGLDVTWTTPFQVAEREMRLAAELLEDHKYEAALEALVRQQAAITRVAQWVLRETADEPSHSPVGA